MVSAEQGDTDSPKTDGKGKRIVGLNTENSEINEGLIRFDIIFYVRMKDGLSKIIINILLRLLNITTFNSHIFQYISACYA